LFTYVTLGVACLAFVLAFWAIYQLLLQNGKLQLRVDALENRLYAQGILTKDEERISRGLALGSVLYDFELPALSGGTMTLSRWRGRKLLLIFFNPSCTFCREMLPELAALSADSTEKPLPVIVSTGDEEENRRLFGSYAITHPVLLQRDTEVASLYWVNSSPSGYLVDENGMTASVLYTGAHALLSAAQRSVPETTPVPAGNGRRGFSRSLEESRIQRDGLKSGTRAPGFTLPLVLGGEISLEGYRGWNILLVFSDPHCEPCNALAPRLERLEADSPELQVIMISRGDPEANRRKIADHGLTFPVALQRHWEISRSYGIFATPVGYWIDEEGLIPAAVAVGTEAILKLAASARSRVNRQSAPVAR
jgi:peroxiredoxin